MLPATRTKNKMAHTVPLSAFALSIVKAALADADGSEHLFPSERQDDQPLAAATVRKAVERLFTNTGDHLTFARFTPHDLRRTVGTGRSRLGVPLETIKRVLNHKFSDVTSVHYMRHEFEAEKRQALDLWGAHVEKLVASPALRTKR